MSKHRKKRLPRHAITRLDIYDFRDKLRAMNDELFDFCWSLEVVVLKSQQIGRKIAETAPLASHGVGLDDKTNLTLTPREKRPLLDLRDYYSGKD